MHKSEYLHPNAHPRPALTRLGLSWKQSDPTRVRHLVAQPLPIFTVAAADLRRNARKTKKKNNFTFKSLLLATITLSPIAFATTATFDPPSKGKKKKKIIIIIITPLNTLDCLMVVRLGVAMMPYNTRRKLLSLPSLGIHLPVSHATRATAQTSPPSAAGAVVNMEVPSKKIKRSHNQSPSSTVNHSKRVPTKYENTPPPSPTAESDEREVNWFKPISIDVKSIKDEIVEAVILQLHKTGNRPHLVKELATILSRSVKIVEQSANPSAIVSSRLSAYIKRSWSPASPCPISKVLETVHPRRTHYYLTTYPHQSVSDLSNRISTARAIISPSISSAASRYDEIDTDRRRELSPSPEIDLFPPEYEDENQDYQTRPSAYRFSCQIKQMPRTLRSTSPPLEKDEKEFTQAARGMQKRKFGDVVSSGVPSEIEEFTPKNFESESFFEKQSFHPSNHDFLSSPDLKSGTFRRNNEESNFTWLQIEADAKWDMRCPELVDLEELDGMFDNL